jgi:hypothetical protein
MNTPLQAQPGARLRARTVTGHKRRSQANGRTRSLRCGHASAARRAPPRAAGTSCIGSRGRRPAPGMRKAARTGRSPQGMSAKARTWSSPTPAPPAGRPPNGRTAGPIAHHSAGMFGDVPPDQAGGTWQQAAEPPPVEAPTHRQPKPSTDLAPCAAAPPRQGAGRTDGQPCIPVTRPAMGATAGHAGTSAQA